MTFNVQNTVEFLIVKMYFDLYSIRQTADHHLWPGEVCTPTILVIYQDKVLLIKLIRE